LPNPVEAKEASVENLPENEVKQEPVKKKEPVKDELTDDEDLIESTGKDDSEVVKKLNTDVDRMKSFSEKEMIDKKFTGIIERAYKAKEDGKISKSTYNEFKKKANDILGGKYKFEKEEAKIKSNQLFEKVKERLVGQDYKKINLSSLSPITPKTVADLIDLTARWTARGIDAGYTLAEAMSKAVSAIKKHPTYKKLVASKELDENAFESAVNGSLKKDKATSSKTMASGT